MATNWQSAKAGHEDEIDSVCVTHNNKIVSGSWDKTVRIWDMNGNQLAVCEGEVTSVCVTPDGKIVSGSWDVIVRIWDISDISLFDCLSVMSKGQAKLIGMMLKWTERLLNHLSLD